MTKFAILFACLPLFLRADNYLLGRADFAAGSAPYGIVAGDFNRDGIPDLAVVANGTGSVSILLGLGAGRFAPPVSYPVGRGPRWILAADVNGDGLMDLAVVNQNCPLTGCPGIGSVSILLGNGDGTFRRRIDTLAGYGPTGLALGDYNGDGKLDLAVSVGDNSTGNTVLTYLGNGDGSFRPPTAYIVGTNPAY